jgi:ferrous iron transport protein A
MGLLPGTSVQVVQVAPLGDPVEIEFNGMRLSLRKADAAAVEVDRAD